MSVPILNKWQKLIPLIVKISVIFLAERFKRAWSVVYYQSHWTKCSLFYGRSNTFSLNRVTLFYTYGTSEKTNLMLPRQFRASAEPFHRSCQTAEIKWRIHGELGICRDYQWVVLTPRQRVKITHVQLWFAVVSPEYDGIIHWVRLYERQKKKKIRTIQFSSRGLKSVS